jgi:hypothetical protein
MAILPISRRRRTRSRTRDAYIKKKISRALVKSRVRELIKSSRGIASASFACANPSLACAKPVLACAKPVLACAKPVPRARDHASYIYPSSASVSRSSAILAVTLPKFRQNHKRPPILHLLPLLLEKQHPKITFHHTNHPKTQDLNSLLHQNHGFSSKPLTSR